MVQYERWRLHNALKEQCKQTSLQELEAALAHYRRLAAAIAEMDEAESLHELTRAAVVGLTTTGAAKYQSLVRRLGCKVLVMEEAAEVRITSTRKQAPLSPLIAEPSSSSSPIPYRYLRHTSSLPSTLPHSSSY